MAGRPYGSDKREDVTGLEYSSLDLGAITMSELHECVWLFCQKIQLFILKRLQTGRKVAKIMQRTLVYALPRFPTFNISLPFVLPFSLSPHSYLFLSEPFVNKLPTSWLFISLHFNVFPKNKDILLYIHSTVKLRKLNIDTIFHLICNLYSNFCQLSQ